MNFTTLKTLIKSDLNRLSNYKFYYIVKFLISNASFKITFWFRVGNYLSAQSTFVSKILLLVVKYIHKKNQYKTGIQLPIGTIVGGGLMFSHFSCVVINNKAIIGNNCTIF